MNLSLSILGSTSKLHLKICNESGGNASSESAIKNSSPTRQLYTAINGNMFALIWLFFIVNLFCNLLRNGLLSFDPSSTITHSKSVNVCAHRYKPIERMRDHRTVSKIISWDKIQKIFEKVAAALTLGDIANWLQKPEYRHNYGVLHVIFYDVYFDQ